MNGYLALRVIAYFALGIGIGILTRGAWGFIAFGVLILLDNLVLGRRERYERSEPPAGRVVVREETVREDRE